MERFTLAQAAAWTHGEAKGEAALTVTTDSRQIPPEALFLPIKGERFDAHDFIGKAIENGAAAVMSHRENEEYPVPTLYVENTSQALLDLAGGYRTMCGGKVVVDVTVDASGRVTYASYRAQGSTTNSKRLVDAAVEAARKARFSSSESLMQTGTITYVFTLE